MCCKTGRRSFLAARLFAVSVLLALAVGCGKKGDLEPPTDKEITYPRTYPRQ